MESQPASHTGLVPLLGVVFVSFLVTGLAMPIVPLHVHQSLGLGTFAVGLIGGSQFAAQLVSRVWAGRHADARGVKQSVTAGLLAAAAGGLLYLLSLAVGDPVESAAVLLCGRAVLGAGESFVITAAQSWGLMIAGAGRTGRILAWMGTAMYAALAVGAPIGTFLYGRLGFVSLALATTLLPLATLLLVSRLRRPIPRPRAGSAFAQVVRAVSLPGCGLALSSVGLGAVTAFVGLLFVARGWPVWPGFTVFAVAFIAARIVLGDVADRIGGARVALGAVLVEAGGLGLLWFSTSLPLAIVGVALTGAGYALAYPAFGVEAVHRAPAQARGLAMGAYTAFLDLTLGVASPALGLIGATAGIASIFFVSAIVVLASAAIALRLLFASTPAASASAV